MSDDKRKRSAATSEGNDSSTKRKQTTKINQGINPINKDGLSECFHKIKTSLYLSLAPIYSKTPLEGLKSQHLDNMIMKHFAPANGVVIGYDNLKLSDEHSYNAGGNNNEDDDEEETQFITAKLNAHSPFAFFWINVDLLVWRPSIGDVVEGLIYMQSPSHIGLLINDTFNASIKKNFIPENWEFIPNQLDEFQDENQDDEENNSKSKKFQSLGQWNDENNMPIDGKIKFTIRRIHTSGRVVSVEGSLIKPGSELEAKPVTPGQIGKKITFNDDLPILNSVPDDVKQDVPTYDVGKSSDNEEVVAENSSSDDNSDSD
ncbi:DNA-directed RNA polymerase I subunit RPA43 [Wickerhamomyces ciferrii]|uniref:DNA-directed RNA polymerase subunit n=1 Tax=Wickerhamomyces ciferrii (strain ATCC 14091 / BCRC 22168 / CBS 111 / JCM 3599 / NBRC 0793 / NRRL Y-1031 F-60-10) TaxID=1206466 RepID=K0KJA1_WICCF|nr:DNA-directed RNA polymerase I subunit RPA43 [Wickerhamomyces ciferrii]CCH45295.1 DNA-directed RNA polymerase I subunit RPA43 [Wickerhamomyces ciferrii]